MHRLENVVVLGLDDLRGFVQPLLGLGRRRGLAHREIGRLQVFQPERLDLRAKLLGNRLDVLGVGIALIDVENLGRLQPADGAAAASPRPGHRVC